jgi:hypothetical protein
MPRMCQCRGDCGYVACCRSVGRKRKQASENFNECEVCRGLGGRDRREFRKRPAAAMSAVPQHADAAAVPGVMERIAQALETLAANSTNAAGSSISPSSVAQRSEPQFEMPVVLQPVLAAAQAASHGGTAGGVLTALSRIFSGVERGMAFAMLQGVTAVAAPDVRLRGLKYDVGGNDASRAQQFIAEGSSVCFISVWSDVGLPTVVQSVARALRGRESERRQHGQRFLGELGMILARLQRNSSQTSSAAA